MNRRAARAAERGGGVPRTRGDEPWHLRHVGFLGAEFPAHAGMNLMGALARAALEHEFPAHAGMNLFDVACAVDVAESSPHTRG